MEKILYTDFVTTEELLADLMKNKDIQKAVTRSNLCKFWSKITGKKFAEKSKPFSMAAGGVMVIACESPAVAQELMLKKTQLLVKLKPYMESLKFKVTDLRFDTKKWSAEN